MNWKRELQVRDIDPAHRLEALCTICGHTHYIDVAALMAIPERQFAWINEIERDTLCGRRGCHAPVRLSILRAGDNSGFVGGLA